VATVRPMDLHI